MRNQYEICEVTGIAECRLGLATLQVHYNESDPLGAVGEVLVSRDGYLGTAKTYLSANCQLNALWASPEGDLWVVDILGHVYTTAHVMFSEPPDARLRFKNPYYEGEWKVTRAAQDQIKCIWGTGNQDVWIATFRGDAFHWDGTQWHRFSVGKAPNVINGFACDDIYLAGYDGALYHWDGARWAQISLPPELPANSVLTDIVVVDAAHIYVSCRNGFILYGNAEAGFQIVDSPRFPWYALGLLKGRLLLAAGPKGIFEYDQGNFRCLKDKGDPVGISCALDAAYFIPAEQKAGAWFVRYQPGATREWSRITT